MRVVNTICDRCGSVVTEGLGVLKPDGAMQRRIVEPIDLCPDCLDGFQAWLRSRIVEDVNRETAEPIAFV